MSAARRLLALDRPVEARVFLYVAVFGLVVGGAYWFLTYEDAGTILLIGFGLATGVIGLRLATDPRARRRAAPGWRAGPPEQEFTDEIELVPNETLTPFAVGIGAAIAATSLVFGPAPLVVGLLPFGWGAWTWLRAAGEELHAVERGEDEE